MLEAALELAGASFRVFPCHYPLNGGCSCGKACSSIAKHPACQHGCLDATSDPATIRTMWDGRPYNIGISTDGLLVVDIDPRNGGAEHWQELREEMGLGILETLTARTGGGGTHYFFLPPNGGLKVPPQLAPGVDLKAVGGYVVGAPSVHSSGARYEWVNAEAPIDAAPAALLQLIERAARPKATSAGPAEGKIGKGGRNNHLTSLAGSMRKRGMAAEAIEAALIKEYELHCEHEPPMAEAELRAIAASVGRYKPDRDPAPGGQEKPQPVESSALLTMELPKAELAVDPIITGPGLWLINGSQKVGKTILGMQMSLSLQAPAPLLDWFKVIGQRNALFIEQDDPSGLAALKPILMQTTIPRRAGGWFGLGNTQFIIETALVDYLESEIREKQLGVIVLDSYTALRPSHSSGGDLVKLEAYDLGLLDALAKRTGCLIFLLHHPSKGSAMLDWSDKAAGSYAMGACTEGQIFISRYIELPIDAGERLIQIRGRHIHGTELVVRFNESSLSFDFVLEGQAAPIYPLIRELQMAFGAGTFGPKSLQMELGWARRTAHRHLERLVASRVVHKLAHGEYQLEVKTP
jgi:hypothetical protein